MKYIESLKNGIDDLLKEDRKYIILGEDIGEPYGGAFKVTKGLQKKYPDQVISTPMSESALTGITTGLAVHGYKPILEIMFGDFITLCTDQLVNHASKFIFLFGISLSMVIRTPMGGYRGYGATHSQSIEKLFFGMPNINIFTPNILGKPGELLKRAINSGKPSLFIENKLDYNRDLIETDTKYDISYLQKPDVISANISGEDEFDGYILTYGGMVKFTLDIIWKLFMNYEISLKLIVFNKIQPLDNKIVDIIDDNKYIFTIEEGSQAGGFNSEIARILLENNKNIKKYINFSAKNEVIGASQELECYVLPDEENIIKNIIDNIL